MKKDASFGERQRRIMEIAATGYGSCDDAAKQYLLAIEGAAVDEQKKLFRWILAHHGARGCKRSVGRLDDSITSERFLEIGRRVYNFVERWSQAAARNNAGVKETADTIWDQLTLYEGDDRVVALGLLLSHDIVPYAQLPSYLTVTKPLDVYEEARDRVSRQIAMLRRAERASGVSILELAAAMTRVLEEVEDRDSRTVLVADFLQRVAERTRRTFRKNQLDTFSKGFVLGSFGLLLDDDVDDEQDED